MSEATPATEWAPLTAAEADGREIIGMDARGRIRGCWNPGGKRPAAFISIDDCEDFKPICFLPCPSRRSGLLLGFAAMEARRAANPPPPNTTHRLGPG